ncbi:DNA helicase [Virgisporangium aliadipatigenens]|uniref:DNA helicase n=1 Tax=Virgisporangium aliadipatigenens TaxID=741659 RepID=A0A8J4DQR1_9ACTN|nr:AAA family ATPase [Virgisporangium aliadipatigenens]GIJ47320.1 DNA helicase [Virgisporangium aliadipatigenens]
MPAPDLDTDLQHERDHLTASRAALHRMRERAEQLYSTGDKVAGDAYTAEQLGRHMARRVRELADDPETPLFFGRLDLDQERDDPRSRYHIGRRHVTDPLGEPMVLDWRAPLSRAFYRASAKDPQHVTVRRRFGFVKGKITSFEDEHLDRGEELGTASRILTAEIERPRVGPMRDIVATIQPEQDELVRAELADTICVQGAPGTGKTAVGLHRAAYLLYLHRERLKRNGVLIVGPNTAFLHYIASVLPALGEVEVQQSTVDGLLPGTEVRSTDSPEAAAVKHDVRMAAVLHDALWAHVRRPTGPLQVSDGAYRWRIDEGVLRRLVDEVRREGPAYGVGRERVRARITALLQRQAEYRSGESPGEAWLRRMGRSKPVVAVLDEVWPAVTGPELVAAVLRDPPAETLTPEERDAIRWAKPPKTVKSARWSAADLVLIDEANGLIDRPASYGHVVVDEAQDLSPMQCRAIARRSEHGSLTVLGDLAQGTAPWAATSWAESLAHLGKPDGRVVPLTTGFRVPEAVLVLANRLLPALAVDVPPAVSLRSDGALRIRPVPDAADALVATVRAALASEGSVGVIAPEARVPDLADRLAAADIAFSDPDQVDSPERVTLLAATVAKGLEYDHVIVVEPAEIVEAEPRGLNRLYVVLTRAVSRLDVLHARPLPDALLTE